MKVTFPAGPIRSGKPWATRRALNKAWTSKAGGGLVMIGCDYGAKSSVAVLMQRNTDGSFTVLDQVEGKGLDDLNTGTSAGQKSDGGSDAESDGR